ncbi:MAG: hypothetical protein K6G26_12255 [Lachnospiraceae bacterium]|nr:hypothetical protein [Lachnospiraceae bacterium]
MNCFEAQNLSMQYVNGDIEEEKIKPFLKHVASCKDCKEELEICYIIVNGMKELEQDKTKINNFHEAFENMFNGAIKKLDKKHNERKIKIIIMVILIIILVLVLTGDIYEFARLS